MPWVGNRSVGLGGRGGLGGRCYVEHHPTVLSMGIDVLAAPYV